MKCADIDTDTILRFLDGLDGRRGDYEIADKGRDRLAAIDGRSAITGRSEPPRTP